MPDVSSAAMPTIFWPSTQLAAISRSEGRRLDGGIVLVEHDIFGQDRAEVPQQVRNVGGVFLGLRMAPLGPRDEL